MRRYLVLALAALVPLAFSAEAFGANKTNFKMTISPAVKSVSAKNLRSVVVGFDLNYVNADAAKIVDPLEFSDVILPSGFKIDPKGKGNCPARTVEQSKNPAKSCPRNSNIGTGEAGFVAAAGTTKIPAKTEKFTKNNAPTNKGILLYKSSPTSFFIFSNAIKPVQDQRVFPGTLRVVGGRPILKIPVYKIVVANLTVSVTDFDSKVSGVFKAATTCPAGGWKAETRTTFRKPDGSQGGSKSPTAKATIRCR